MFLHKIDNFAAQKMDARVAKLVDALVSGSSAERHAGSIPVPGTQKKSNRNLPKGRFLFLL